MIALYILGVLLASACCCFIFGALMGHREECSHCGSDRMLYPAPVDGERVCRRCVLVGPAGPGLRAVVFYDRGWWVAQCLEHNLTASSKDRQELPAKIRRVVKVQREADLQLGRIPFGGLSPAPRRFWALLGQAEVLHIEEGHDAA